MLSLSFAQLCSFLVSFIPLSPRYGLRSDYRWHLGCTRLGATACTCLCAKLSDVWSGGRQPPHCSFLAFCFHAFQFIPPFLVFCLWWGWGALYNPVRWYGLWYPVGPRLRGLALNLACAARPSGLGRALTGPRLPSSRSSGSGRAAETCVGPLGPGDSCGCTRTQALGSASDRLQPSLKAQGLNLHNCSYLLFKKSWWELWVFYFKITFLGNSFRFKCITYSLQKM